MTDLTILGTLREEDGRGVVHVEDIYSTDIDDLWSAVTQPDRLARWLADLDGDPAAGPVGAKFTSGWEGTLRVEVCDAPRHLLVSSTDDDGDGVIEATLVAEGERTRLIIEERGLPVPEYVAHGAGWQAHLEDLESYLAGRERASWIDRLRALRPSYEALLEK
jgi:uncharacterized protein YndB with AHSA1/START domain